MTDSIKGVSVIAKLLQSEKAKDKIKQTFVGKVFHSKVEKSKVTCLHPDKMDVSKDNDKDILTKW